MLRNLSKNKPFMVLALVMVLLLAAGGTYAWFTLRVQSDLIIDVGELKVDTTLTVDENNPIVVEPGTSHDYNGVVTNRGTIASAVLVDYTNSAQVTIKSNDDGNPLEPWQYYTVSPGSDLIGVAFDESTLGWGSNTEGDKFFQWFSVNGEPSKYLLLLYGQNTATADVKYSVELDGPGLGNEYNHAELNVAGEWKATQALGAAIYDQFELVVFGADANVTPLYNAETPLARRAGPTQSDILSKFEEILSR